MNNNLGEEIVEGSPHQQPNNYGDSDEFHHEAKMNYNADPEFATAYHNDAYNPDTHNYHQGIYTSIQEYLDVFVVENPKYDNLRTLDASKLRAGDTIGCSTRAIDQTGFTNKHFTIVEIVENKLKVQNGNKVYTISIADIKILDEQLLRLRGQDLSFIYIDFKRKTKVDSHIDFFHNFSEYFKMNDKMLYDSLPEKVKNQILEELNERTGCLKKQNNFNW